MDDDVMPIGWFARACRLSVKALRHYDATGLLAPAFVDSETGYRYYGRDEVRPAVAIALLRSLGRILGAGDLFPYEIAVVEEPPRLVARLTRETTVARLVEDSTALVAELLGLATRLGWSWSDPIVGLYPPDLADPCTGRDLRCARRGPG